MAVRFEFLPTSNLQPPSVMVMIRKKVVHLKLRMEATEQLLKQGFIARRRGEEERKDADSVLLVSSLHRKMKN